MQIVDAEVSVPRKYVGGINTRGGGGDSAYERSGDA